MIKAFFKYRKRAVNAYKIHSPFVFEFYNEVIKKAQTIDDSQIRKVRQRLLKDHSEIQITDLGQGSKKNNSNKRKISELVKVQAISKKYGRLLARLVEHYQLENCLELGTSLGFGTAYLAMNSTHVTTIEGCGNIQNETMKAWSDVHNVSYVLGDFDAQLPRVFESMEKVDLVYVDGNHGYEPTLRYFKQILEKVHNDTFIVFDDINWSEGMTKAWKEIISHEEIHVSIELFRMGIVLKRSEQAKEHFVLKY